jgi:septum formation protein
MKYILASASPRRKELLETAGYTIEVLPSEVEEVITSKNPKEIVMSLALQKANDVVKKVEKENEFLVIGADTIVVLEDKILGKPSSRENASEMLSSLQGKNHEVYTGVALLYSRQGIIETLNFAEKAEVFMYPMTETEIKEYVASGEPDDKAGAYAIQGKAMKYVERICGDYQTIVGLPVARIYQEIKRKWGELK